ncbi:MAG: hypothetical protein GY749_15195 [Desulfobacteraceae bacterium]|nr:hypothetical protein [Desulfobacteraceae bacterium]
MRNPNIQTGNPVNPANSQQFLCNPNSDTVQDDLLFSTLLNSRLFAPKLISKISNLRISFYETYPTVDCVFKAILGKEENKNLLIHFLNAVPEPPAEEKITENHRDFIYFKDFYILCVLCAYSVSSVVKKIYTHIISSLLRRFSVHFDLAFLLPIIY